MDTGRHMPEAIDRVPPAAVAPPPGGLDRRAYAPLPVLGLVPVHTGTTVTVGVGPPGVPVNGTSTVVVVG
jgi:hypothetical protein